MKNTLRLVSYFLLGYGAAFILLALVACADSKTVNVDFIDTDTSCIITGNLISCPDGSYLEVTNNVNRTVTNVPANSCVQVGPNIYVENIQNGRVFDVYINANCSDIFQGNLSEYCDNVEPSFGHSGSLGINKSGDGTVCSFDNKLIYGDKLSDNSININVITID